jgi:mandelate racemase
MPYKVMDGQLHIPDVAGVGLDWNEGAVKANQANL